MRAVGKSLHHLQGTLRAGAGESAAHAELQAGAGQAGQRSDSARDQQRSWHAGADGGRAGAPGAGGAAGLSRPDTQCGESGGDRGGTVRIVQHADEGHRAAGSGAAAGAAGYSGESAAGVAVCALGTIAGGHPVLQRAATGLLGSRIPRSGFALSRDGWQVRRAYGRCRQSCVSGN